MTQKFVEHRVVKTTAQRVADALDNAWPDALDSYMSARFATDYQTTWNTFAGEHGAYVTSRKDDGVLTTTEVVAIETWCLGWDAAREAGRGRTVYAVAAQADDDHAQALGHPDHATRTARTLSAPDHTTAYVQHDPTEPLPLAVQLAEAEAHADHLHAENTRLRSALLDAYATGEAGRGGMVVTLAVVALAGGFMGGAVLLAAQALVRWLT